MPDTTDEPFGDAALLKTAGDFPSVGADAGLSDLDRFRVGVSRLIEKRLAGRPEARKGIAGDHPCVFLLTHGGPPEDAAGQCTRVPMLDRGREEVSGKVWFVPHVLSLGFWLEAKFGDDDQLFKYVTDNLGQGGTPAIVFDPRDPGPELRVYPEGLDSPEIYESLHIPGTAIPLDDVFAIIDVVHQKHLVTPGAQHAGNRLWKSARDGVASSSAEDVLSGLLVVALQASYPMCYVRPEQAQATGRLDIEIEESVIGSPGQFIRHILLEIKILRGRRPNGQRVGASTIAAAISEGLLQAAAYKNERGTLQASLCCFDMRDSFTGHECFAHVREDADDMEIVLRAWHLFDSSAAYRRHLAASGQLATKADARDPQ